MGYGLELRKSGKLANTTKTLCEGTCLMPWHRWFAATAARSMSDDRNGLDSDWHNNTQANDSVWN